jgi:transitional endoplasmic reticulum ATPase
LKGLSKSSVGKDVDLKYLAQITVHFTGFDLVEICRRCSQLAARQSIDKEQRLLDQTSIGYGNTDEVPAIRCDQLEETVNMAPRTVQDNDIQKFEKYCKRIQEKNYPGQVFRFP